MNKKTIITTLLALVTMAGLAQTKTAESKADSLLLLVQAGDSCMQQYNTFEALKYYKEAYAIAKPRSQYCTVQMKLANCHYKRGNYRETADILKLVPEDSLSHEAFRQLCFSYQKQGDNDSFIYLSKPNNRRVVFSMDYNTVRGIPPISS